MSKKDYSEFMKNVRTLQKEKMSLTNVVKGLKMFGINIVSIEINKYPSVEDDYVKLENDVHIAVASDGSYAYVGRLDGKGNIDFTAPTKSLVEIISTVDYVVTK